jgi:hypothetical protein
MKNRTRLYFQPAGESDLNLALMNTQTSCQGVLKTGRSPCGQNVDALRVVWTA